MSGNTVSSSGPLSAKQIHLLLYGGQVHPSRTQRRRVRLPIPPFRETARLVLGRRDRETVGRSTGAVQQVAAKNKAVHINIFGVLVGYKTFLTNANNEKQSQEQRSAVSHGQFL